MNRLLWTLREAAALTGGKPPALGADLPVSGVSIDTRTLRRGDLYVAIRGKRLDGHAFVAEAARKGAVGALVERPLKGVPIPQVLVADGTAALGCLGRARRLAWGGPVAAVTGSVGKTTVKDLTAHLLAASGPVLATKGNLNNQWGLPLTLLRLEGTHRSAVVELGISHPGEMGPLSDTARPDAAAVTNVGDSHRRFLGSRARVAREKLRILDGLRAGGWAVLNHDDPFLRPAGGGRKITFGLSGGDFTASSIRVHGDRTTFHLRHGRRSFPAWIPLLGAHHVVNALGAVALASCLGADPEKSVRRLRAFRPVSRMRMEPVARRGVFFVNDAYNASPASVEAALDCLSGMEAKGRKAVLLGDMLELGPVSDRAHRDALVRAFGTGAEKVGVVGPSFRRAAAALGLLGSVDAFGDPAAAGKALARWAEKGDLVLLKGSRGLKLEQALEAF